MLIEGTLVQQRWDDPASGQKRSRVGIVAREIQYLPRGGNGPAEEEGPPLDEGEIPF